MNYIKEKQLEDIELSSRVVVSDPCYSRDTWCRGELTVTPGVYETRLFYSDGGNWGTRVAKLGIYRKGAAEAVDEKKAEFNVGVDSGQAGIFCDTIYPQGETGDWDGKGSFYDKVCELTIGNGYKDRSERARAETRLKDLEEGRFEDYPEAGRESLKKHCLERLAQPEIPYWKGGTLDGKGLVSSSGYGDGSYDCVVGTDADGNTTYVEIEFIVAELDEE